MQPYQEASEEIRRAGDRPANLIKKGASLGLHAASAYAGGATASKILPFLSNYIPQSLAIKGLSKIDSRWGKFITAALDEGYDFDEVKDFIKKKAEGKKEEPQEQPKENRNIIEQYSPELHQFIDQEVRKGRPLIQAGAVAQNNPKFAQVIDKLQKDHKTPWSNILQSIYGGALQDQGQQQQPQQGGGQGDIDPALQQLIQQGNSILQKFKGG